MLDNNSFFLKQSGRAGVFLWDQEAVTWVYKQMLRNQPVGLPRYYDRVQGKRTSPPSLTVTVPSAHWCWADESGWIIYIIVSASSETHKDFFKGLDLNSIWIKP